MCHSNSSMVCESVPSCVFPVITSSPLYEVRTLSSEPALPFSFIEQWYKSIYYYLFVIVRQLPHTEKWCLHRRLPSCHQTKVPPTANTWRRAQFLQQCKKKEDTITSKRAIKSPRAWMTTNCTPWSLNDLKWYFFFENTWHNLLPDFYKDVSE